MKQNLQTKRFSYFQQKSIYYFSYSLFIVLLLSISNTALVAETNRIFFSNEESFCDSIPRVLPKDLKKMVDYQVSTNNVLGSTEKDTDCNNPVKFPYRCDQGVVVETIIKEGGKLNTNIMITRPRSVKRVIVEVIYKYQTFVAPDSIKIMVRKAGEEDFMEKYLIKTRGPAGEGGTIYKRTFGDPISEITYTHTSISGNVNLLQSVTAFVYKEQDGISNTQQAVISVATVGWREINAFPICLPHDNIPSVRNIKLTIPISEIDDDGRMVKIRVSGKGFSQFRERYYPMGYNFTLGGCCIDTMVFNLKNVPNTTNEILVTINPESSSSHQSYVMGSIVIEQECCIKPTATRQTITECPTADPVDIRLRRFVGNIDDLKNPRFMQGAINTKNGGVMVGASGRVTYTPDNIYCGRDSFNYTVCDQGQMSGICCDTRKVILVFEDNEPPVINPIPDITANCGEVPFPDLTTSDNCNNAVDIETYHTPFQMNDACTQVQVRKWVAIDICGNRSDTLFQRVVLIDTLPPEFTNFPPDITVDCNEVPEVPTNLTATDDCDSAAPTVTFLGQDKDPNIDIECYILTRTWEAKDKCGNADTMSQQITVQDTISPVFTNPPSDTTVQCNNIPIPSLKATDNCAATVQILFLGETVEQVSPWDFIYTRVWEAKDNCDNTTILQQNVRVTDTIPPVFIGFPRDTTVECDDVLPPVRQVKAVDTCDTMVEVIYLGEETDTISPCEQRILRIWQAIDDCTNSIRDTQIIRRLDFTAPTFDNIPSNVTIECDEMVIVPEVTASDNCDTEVEVQYLGEEIKEALMCDTIFIRRWQARDDCGSILIDSQLIWKIDTKPPMVTNIPKDITLSCKDDIPNEMPEAEDNCSEVNIMLKEMENVICEGNKVIDRIWTIKDNCDNDTIVMQRITIQDTIPPILIGDTTDMTISCDVAWPTIPEIIGMDECSGVTIEIIITPEPGACLNDSVLTIKWIGKDECDNTTMATKRISKLDDQDPELLNCVDTVRGMATDECSSINVQIEKPNAIDNCDGDVEVISSRDLTLPFPVGTTTVTFTAIDNCGNMATCKTVVVVDNIPFEDCVEDINITDKDCDEPVTWEPPNGNECCSSCDENFNIPNYQYIGYRGGHRYYLSKTRADWNTAAAKAKELGGTLAIINDPAENAYLLANLTANYSALIGLSDAISEGNYQWEDGSPVTYTNWKKNEPKHKKGVEDYVRMLSSGEWVAEPASDSYFYLVEINCVDVIQTSGPLNGSILDAGTYTVTYTINYKDCKNPDFCEFDIIVEDCALKYCNACGEAKCFWINRIGLADLDHTSGNDGGCADFTDLTANITQGKKETMLFQPGFMDGHYFDLQWFVYIDYNRNGNFDVPDELVIHKADNRVFNDLGDDPVFDEFTVPSTVSPGLTRMRIIMKFTEYADPCEEFVFGEVEDYTVNIMPNSLRLSNYKNDNVLKEKIYYEAKRQEGQYWKPTNNYKYPLGKEEESLFLSLYPNPVQTALFVKITGLKSKLAKTSIKEKSTLKIYNHYGQEVYFQILSNNATSTQLIDVESFASGLYFIELKDESNKTIVKKFTKF